MCVCVWMSVHLVSGSHLVFVWCNGSVQVSDRDSRRWCDDSRARESIRALNTLLRREMEEQVRDYTLL